MASVEYLFSKCIKFKNKRVQGTIIDKLR